MSDREEREEHIKRLEAALACEEKQFSGKCLKSACDDNCALLYEQGNWGEWKDTLRYAINSLKTDLKYDLMYEGALEQEEPRWITTSERQPEENGNYLAFYRSSDGTATLEFMMVDHCNAGGGWLHEESGKKSYKKVIAWMPLPKPYKGESEG